MLHCQAYIWKRPLILASIRPGIFTWSGVDIALSAERDVHNNVDNTEASIIHNPVVLHATVLHVGLGVRKRIYHQRLVSARRPEVACDFCIPIGDWIWFYNVCRMLKSVQCNLAKLISCHCIHAIVGQSGAHATGDLNRRIGPVCLTVAISTHCHHQQCQHNWNRFQTFHHLLLCRSSRILWCFDWRLGAKFDVHETLQAAIVIFVVIDRSCRRSASISNVERPPHAQSSSRCTCPGIANKIIMLRKRSDYIFSHKISRYPNMLDSTCIRYQPTTCAGERGDSFAAGRYVEVNEAVGCISYKIVANVARY